MTPEEFALKMAAIARDGRDSPEEKHIEMDGLMIDLLVALGYGDGVQIFCEQEKWYS